MSLRHFKAHFDGKAIQLDEPAILKPGAAVYVVVADDVEESLESFREDWLRYSAQGLARAYGEDEPEYSESDCIK